LFFSWILRIDFLKQLDTVGELVVILVRSNSSFSVVISYVSIEMGASRWLFGLGWGWMDFGRSRSG
jgi:hypothetical protein